MTTTHVSKPEQLDAALADLSANKISSLTLEKVGSKDLLRLAEALRANTTLFQLRIARSSLKPESFAALFDVLAHHPSLQVLGLVDSVLRSDLVAPLLSLLRTNKCIHKLDLSSNRLGNDGARLLSAAMADLDGLTSLDLEGNGIEVDGGATFVAPLMFNFSLIDLRISLNITFTKDIQPQIQALIQRNQHNREQISTCLLTRLLLATEESADGNEAKRSQPDMM